MSVKPEVEVILNVEFSEEEREVIETYHLEDYVVLERLPNSRIAAMLKDEELKEWAPSFHLRISHLIKDGPDFFSFDTPADAKIYQRRLTESLKELKEFIADNASLAPPISFEL